jgi:hypothetical protein
VPVAFLVTLVAVGAAQLLADGLAAPYGALSGALAVAAGATWAVSRRLHARAIREVATGPGAGAPRSRSGAGRHVLELLNVAFGLALAAVLTVLGAIGAP